MNGSNARISMTDAARKSLFPVGYRPIFSFLQKCCVGDLEQDNSNMATPFHLAFYVRALNESREFYSSFLGCTEGRSTEAWIDFNFFGHQISMHLETR